MDYQFDFSFLSTGWRDLLDGVWLTLRMSVATIVFGFVLGTALAVVRTQGPAWARRCVTVYVDVIRNTPLVIQAFWLFFGLAAVQVRVPAMAAAVVALVVNVSAYTTEIVRAGIESVPRGQLEAASCLGLSRWQMLRLVVLPQAVERMYPALISQFVLMMLATSIMSQISAEELTAVGYRIQSETFRGFEIYLVIALVYLLLSWLLRLSMAGIGALAFTRRRRLQTPL
ncbi:ABC-type transporter, permease component: PAAT family [Cupriavidus necator]|uniref:ABC-type transporter, permease component: PAAT family n=1 Tax=Cupriavidus necator (strain ATCC 17699 / DSM 428 / KCTC 22496 / NCIMB 10442 / H16 / Stanier 337) TaxID=381666 RepID=Q0K838_CUPNH|nr:MULTISPECIES: amino acid ABC transporter permease [Cupriavidus]EON17096.1 ABC transporter permease [Cupriavidus sp. GA3-3]KUE90486.1 ABC transporter permease [Cupriavidus necator]QCC01610.1 amino acid ABC transporter permease [Cupriavidus necator H16]QQB75558.1 amino acid ABC transporter permease [Cupriavidus necator]WKA40005.1 amino acid ABC transporter permease [Cupriavidus necator]